MLPTEVRLPFEESPPVRRSRRLARRGGAPLRGRSVAQRRPRGLGRHRQDARARDAVREPAPRRRRSGQHPRHHLHEEGGRGDARADRPPAARAGARLGGRRGAVAGAARPPRRHRHQHDRRVLPVAAPRVPARGRPRPGLRGRGRDRASAARGRGARRDGADWAPARRERPGVTALFARLGDSRGARGDLARCSTGGWWPRPGCAGSSARGPSPDAARAFDRLLDRVVAALPEADGGLEGFLASGPRDHPAYALFEGDLRAVAGPRRRRSRAPLDRIGAYFATKTGKPRSRPAPGFRKEHCATPGDWTRHTRALAAAAPSVVEALAAFGRDLNRVMARGVRRLFTLAARRYRAALEERDALDFSEGLARRWRLLRRMDEFAQSRYRLEARYHHVLVDEFQDTSRAQWQLVAAARSRRGAKAWASPTTRRSRPRSSSSATASSRSMPSATRTCACCGARARHIAALRPGGDVRPDHRAQLPFRAAAARVRQRPVRRASTAPAAAPTPSATATSDRFPSSPADGAARGEAADAASLGGASLPTARRRRGGRRRDRAAAARGDASATGRRGVARRSAAGRRRHPLPLAREPPRVRAGARAAARPDVRLQGPRLLRGRRGEGRPRAAALSRASPPRTCPRGRLPPVARRAPVRRRARPPRARLASSLRHGRAPCRRLDEEDARALDLARAAVRRWLALVDRLPPAELLDRVLVECAYAFELRGPRLAAGVREREEGAGADPADPEPRDTRRSARSPTTSSGCRRATSRTRSSTPPTRST